MSTTFEPVMQVDDDKVVARDRSWPAVVPATDRYLAWKSAFDRLLAVLLLIPGLPLMGLLIVLVKLTSKGPGIYRQVRVGLGGENYTMYKIRTMSSDAEAKSGPVWTQSRDPRITRIGMLLRLLHLDEIPQLINVIKGEMSLIGPRPERPEFVCVLVKQIPGYMNRLAVRPGITGLAQLNLPPDTDLDSVRRKQMLDLLYIDTCGAWLDFRILASTLLRMFGLRHGLAVRWLGLKRDAVLASDPTNHQALDAPAPADVAIRTNRDTVVDLQFDTVDEENDEIVSYLRQHRNPSAADSQTDDQDSEALLGNRIPSKPR